MKTLTCRTLGIAAIAALASLGFAQTQDLQYATFNLPQGQIKVALTNDLSAGAQFSGTVIAEPKGKNDADRKKNEGVLQGYVVEAPGARSKAGEMIKFMTPALGTGLVLNLLDLKGKSAGTQQLPLLPNQPSQIPTFDLPTLAQPGQPISIPGPCDGDLSNLTVKIGGVVAPVMAESPWRAIVACPPDTIAGSQRIELAEGSATAFGTAHVFTVTLGAQRTIARGESTPLQVVIRGLEGFEHPSRLCILNNSPKVIRLDAGMHGAFHGNVLVDLAAFGQAETSRPIESISLMALAPGGFEVKAELMAGGGQCGATTHEMKIHGPSKENKGGKYHVKWKEQCQLGTCYLKPDHAGDHAYAWRTCKDHAEVEHDEVFDDKEKRDAKYREVEKDRDKREAEHDF